jgi:hypothetical protein
MAERESWDGMRERRLAEPGAAAAYAAARLAFELGAAVRELRVARKWSQAELAAAAGSQSRSGRVLMRSTLALPAGGGSRWRRHAMAVMSPSSK